jgi:hypothetical protein
MKNATTSQFVHSCSNMGTFGKDLLLLEKKMS